MGTYFECTVITGCPGIVGFLASPALIAEKLGISQPTLSEHMWVLSDTGLVQSQRIKQWTFYQRIEARIKEIKRSIAASL